jgi:ABC-2 type transport system permease protein
LTAILIRLTFRQVLGRRSLLVALGIAAIAFLVVLIFRLDSGNAIPERWTARVLLNGLFVTTLLPLTALLFGTSVLGSDIEDGTDVFLLVEPVSRAQIVFAKLAVATIVAMLCILPAAVVAALIALGGDGGGEIVFGFAVAIVAACLAYTAVFVLLSVVTRRALIAGLVYVFLWEGVVSSIFKGMKIFSIRQYTLGIADLIAKPDPNIFSSNLDGKWGVLLIVAVTIAAIAFAIRRLQNYEVNEIA